MFFFIVVYGTRGCKYFVTHVLSGMWHDIIEKLSVYNVVVNKHDFSLQEWETPIHDKSNDIRVCLNKNKKT